ncbi:hypothetical protein EON65_11475 [archaeon]|nr:MAG: hypothetical protein EON65_11475 [archaeon]
MTILCQYHSALHFASLAEVRGQLGLSGRPGKTIDVDRAHRASGGSKGLALSLASEGAVIAQEIGL